MRIGVFTGSRANYSSTKTIIRAINADPELELVSIVGGAASLSRYGAIPELMVSDSLPRPDFVFNAYIDGENTSDMVKSCALGLIECSTIFSNITLDALVVVGDRYDVMSPTIAAAYMNIPIIHTMGGEVTGTIDESIRHAITKFAHLHLVANDDARSRVLRLGERPDTVFTVGCPRLDLVSEAIQNDNLTNDQYQKKYPGVGHSVDIESDFLLVSYHPVTSEIEQMRAQVRELLLALNVISMPTILLWPNFDAGGGLIAKEIRTFREEQNPNWLQLQTNFSVEDYSRLMNRTKCLIGNSSSGIREGAFLGTPVVNIGSRQHSRVAAQNVYHVSNNKEDIILAIQSQLHHGSYESSDLYGDGKTGPRIARAIKNMDLSYTQKVISY